MSRKEKTKRKIDPYFIRFYNGTFYLIGFCHLRDKIRTFVMSRIKMLSQSGETFEKPDGLTLDAIVAPSFGVYDGEPQRVKIWFSAEAAGYIREKKWHESQKIEDHENGGITLEAEVAGLQDVRNWVLSWGRQAVVLEPEELRDELSEEAAAMLGMYGEERASRSV
jgi:predicted DNA-binding transcriptional regulator YafY